MVLSCRTTSSGLAPDFVGMGWSGKSPNNAYRFVDQARYMDAWFDALQLTQNVTLVVHDWGAPTGLRAQCLRAPDCRRLLGPSDAVLAFPGQ